MKKISKFIFLFLVFLIFPHFAFAQSEQVNNFNEEINVQKDGSIEVIEKIDYHFDQPKHGIFRKIPIKYQDKDQKNFTLDLSNIKILDQNNHGVAFQKSESGGDIVLKIGDPNKTVSGDNLYQIFYKVTGVINYFSDHDELYWNVTGNEWEVPIVRVLTKVNLPETVKSESVIANCFTGQTGSREQNCQKNIDGRTITFNSNGNLTIVAGWNKGAVAEVQKNYTGNTGIFRVPTKLTVIFLLLPFLIPIISLIFMIRLIRKYGGGIIKHQTVVPEFVPPQGLTPAEMGTILDSKVDPKDLTAEIIKFASDGFIRIKEVRGSWFSQKDYELTALKDLPSSAKPYEKRLFTTIFEGDNKITLTRMKERTNAAGRWKLINDDLYTQVTQGGYYIQNPNLVRRGYWIISIIFGVAGFLLFFAGTLGIALFLSGLVIFIGGRFMPKRTAKGIKSCQKIIGFREFISKAEKYRARWAEKENLFFDFLPYAVMFGVTQKWAKAFEGVNVGRPDWYEGNWATFSTIVFVSSLDNFNSSWGVASSGAPSGGSGFGGGGFSGGGFGGGGGGSW